MRKLLILLLVVGALPSIARAQTPPETIEYYGTDAIGSIRIVFQPDGATVGRQDYAPFGRPLFPVPAPPKEAFGGQEKDDEADQAYFHARMFQARTGRFTRADPLFGSLFEPQRLNRYSYALNNPLVFRDTTGLNAAANEPCTWVEVQTDDGLSGHLNCKTPSTTSSGGGGGLSDVFAWLAGRLADTFLGATAVGGAESEIAPTAPRYTPSPAVEAAAAILTVAAVIASPVAKSMVEKDVAIAAAGAAAGETRIIAKAGSTLNRVFDSRYTPGSKYARPNGLSYTPGDWLPTSSSTAIADRGLNPALNNARMGGVYQVLGDFPATLRTSVGGTTPEIVISPQFAELIRLIEVSLIPGGG